MNKEQVKWAVGCFRNSGEILLRAPLRVGATRSQMPINKTSHLLLCGILLLGTCGKTFAQTDSSNSKSDALGTLKVMSMHRMSSAEIRAHPDDYLDARIVLVLRYESPTDRSVYLYAPPNCPPEGYLVERTGGKVVWFASRVNGKDGSPGFHKLQRDIGDGWIYLPSNSAIEWQTRTVDTALGSEHAWSVFVKGKHEATPHEVLSNWFS